MVDINLTTMSIHIQSYEKLKALLFNWLLRKVESREGFFTFNNDRSTILSWGVSLMF
jgi:hypothetical protein